MTAKEEALKRITDSFRALTAEHCQDDFPRQMPRFNCLVMAIVDELYRPPFVLNIQAEEISLDCNATLTESPTFCGYTEEQWQEIIAGGFLCEFSADGKNWNVSRMELNAFHPDSVIPFYSIVKNGYSNCRPVKAKGIRRPIFVKPSNLNAECIFITDRKETKTTRWMFFANFKEMFPATSYIEL